MKRIVVDTNVLISALGWGGKPLDLLNYCIDKKAILITSPEITKELEDVLTRKQFDFLSKEDKKEFIVLISEIAEIIIPNIKYDIVRDKKDNFIIDLASYGNVDYIISGDSDLLELKEIDGIKIISVIDFLSMTQ